MVHFVTGGIDSGKTTRLAALFEGLDGAAGFVSRKVLRDGARVGYDLENLVTRERLPLARTAGEGFPAESAGAPALGPFLFSPAAFAEGIRIVREALESGCPAVFLDEVGRIELAGGGFHRAVVLALASGRDAFLAVRDAFLEDTARAYGILEYRVIGT